MRLLACSALRLELRENGLTFLKKHRHLVDGDCPDHDVVDRRIVMRELVAEVDNAAGV